MTEPSSVGQVQWQPVRHGAPQRLCLSGDWTLAHYARLAHALTQLPTPLPPGTEVDTQTLGHIDTAGASLLHTLLGPQRLCALSQDANALRPAQRALLCAVSEALDVPPIPEATPSNALLDVLAHIGQTVQVFGRHLWALLGFIGLILQTVAQLVWQPRRWRMTAWAAHLERTGLDAVPIVALLTFLVGAVVAFLGATVLSRFGASIFTVDLVAFSFLREFGTLLAAILVAGRTASAFTAQIGAMRANEEIDAIRVQGLNPVELLVLPRVCALLLALPLLSFVAMACGMVGGLLVCALTLDIAPTLFVSVVESHVGLRHFLIGMAKAPIFAFLIAVIGCLEGFKVEGSAQSVGEHTTSAVVQSIFVVIVVDALAALFCMKMGW